MLICGQLLLLQAIAQHNVDFLKENWHKSKKVNISGSTRPNKSFKMGKLSLAEARNLLLLHCISLDSLSLSNFCSYAC